MAIRNIRTLGDSILTKECKQVKEINGKILTLIEDMLDTMYEANGVGLAAPQIGILKRVAIVRYEDKEFEVVNPTILKTKGTSVDDEGCLSVKDQRGLVERPAPYLGLPNEQTESQDTHQERAAFVLVEAHTLVLIQNQTIEVREAQTTKTKGEIQDEMKDS